MDKEYYTVRINTIRANEEVPFDLFIPLGNRMIQYTHALDELEDYRIKNLKKHGLKKLYIRPEDESQYLSYLEEGLGTLTNKQISVEDRGALAHDTMVNSVENAEKNLETETGYNSQKRQIEQITAFIGDERQAIKSILTSAGVTPDSHQHSATVSSLCLAVAKKLGTLSQEEMTELAYAAMLHDIGKSRLKFNHNVPFESLTKDQQKQYKNHPADGVAMLAGKPFISPRILGLIAAHEEYGEGRGYPEKKFLSKMELPYQILSLTNKFDKLCRDRQLQPFQAMDVFFEQYGSYYEEDLISTLATVLT